MTKRDVAKTDQQGKRISRIQDVEGRRSSGKRPSYLEKIDGLILHKERKEDDDAERLTSQSCAVFKTYEKGYRSFHSKGLLKRDF